MTTVSANIIKQSLQRPADFGIRYGGDEFAVVLANTDKMGALTVAGNISTAIEKSTPICGGVSLKGTITIGIATVIAQPSGESDASVLSKGADSALYKAKENGRNQVGVFANGIIELVT